MSSGPTELQLVDFQRWTHGFPRLITNPPLQDFPPGDPDSYLKYVPIPGSLVSEKIFLILFRQHNFLVRFRNQITEVRVRD